MDIADQYRLRIRHCVGTIIDVHSSINREYDNAQLVSDFQDLEKAIEGLDMSLVSEGDILMVEQATNALLGEFKTLFETGMLGPVCGQALN
ncbi:MAG: hypothetical protein R6U38_06175 [Desulfatiglandaceae bacterium]